MIAILGLVFAAVAFYCYRLGEVNGFEEGINVSKKEEIDANRK
jgi:hypothetical protein